MAIELVDALEANQENETLDFKETFDVASKGEWLEIIKDIVAMANSGGGILLIGVADDGTPSGIDISPIVNFDSADITNKIFAYTGHQFGNFSIRQVQKSGQEIAAIMVGDTRIPIVFTKPGNYQGQKGKQKSAFSIGSLYFRHGSKSEPCTSEDLRKFLEREIDRIKDSWLSGIRKVVEAPEGSQVLVVSTEANGPESGIVSAVRVVDDQDAPAVRLEEEDIQDKYPFDYRKLSNAMRERYTDFLENKKYHRIRKSLEDNPRYCWIRHLNLSNPSSTKITLFSRDIFEEFDKHYTKKNT